jgi:hypothetical protein
MAGDEADLVADLEPVGGAGDAEAAVLVGGALVGGGGLVADERRASLLIDSLGLTITDIRTYEPCLSLLRQLLLSAVTGSTRWWNFVTPQVNGMRTCHQM